jgi:hypothetical protein
MRTSMRGLAAGALAFAASAALLAGCADESVHVTGSYRYDEQATLVRADATREATKKALAGLSAALEFRSDNTYTLSVRGGPKPIESTGTFKSAYGYMSLFPKVLDGKTVSDPSAVEIRAKAPDRASLELNVAGETVVLVRK